MSVADIPYRVTFEPTRFGWFAEVTAPSGCFTAWRRTHTQAHRWAWLKVAKIQRAERRTAEKARGSSTHIIDPMNGTLYPTSEETL